MLSLRKFMFEHVYLGPDAKVEHERAHETITRIYRHLTRARAGERRRRRVHRRDDRPLRAVVR